jgi:inhibitor of KinA sporulation pathway (predicted exonuclease)
MTKKFDILAWWKAQATRFPTLSQLARDVLAIQIATVASESAFSTGGCVIDDYMTSLTPFMAEALICTQDWLKRTTRANLLENEEHLTSYQEGDNFITLSLCHLLFLLFCLLSN